MSRLHFTDDLYLGRIELDRLMSFLDTDGWRLICRKNAGSFGVIKDKADANFNNFKIENGSTVGTIKLANSSYAVDSDGLIIYKAAEDNISVTDDNTEYAVRISHLYSVIEAGKVTINQDGQLTGSGTAFLTTLRGQPDFPSRIIFPSSAVNTQAYTVIEVIDDNNAILSGIFNDETDIDYAVYGTYTAGAAIQSGESKPFRYDSCTMSIVDPNAAKIDGKEFDIAYVKNNAGTVSIKDKRHDIFMTNLAKEISDVISDNPLLGIESVKYDNGYTTKTKNIVTVGWGIRTASYVKYNELRKIVITGLGGVAGRFKSLTDFTDGDFDGWRVYSGATGGYSKVITSVLSGGYIHLTLDIMDPDVFGSSEISVVPDADYIEFEFRGSYGTPANINKIVLFGIAQGYANVWLTVPTAFGNTYDYVMTYRVRKMSIFTEWRLPEPDETNGYYTEVSFNENGGLKANPLDWVLQTYTPDFAIGYLRLSPAPDNYYQRIGSIASYDLFGVAQTAVLEQSQEQAFKLTPGSSKQNQIFSFGQVLTNGIPYISLETASAQEGNSFNIYLKVNTGLTVPINIHQNYVSPSDRGTAIKSLSGIDLELAKNGGIIVIRAIYNGTNWEVYGFNEKLTGFQNYPRNFIIGDSTVSGYDDLDEFEV